MCSVQTPILEEAASYYLLLPSSFPTLNQSCRWLDKNLRASPSTLTAVPSQVEHALKLTVQSLLEEFLATTLVPSRPWRSGLVPIDQFPYLRVHTSLFIISVLPVVISLT